MRRNPLDISRVADQGTVLTIRNDPGGCQCGCQTRRSPGFLQGFLNLKRNMEATGGFEPPNRGFADLRVNPVQIDRPKFYLLPRRLHQLLIFQFKAGVSTPVLRVRREFAQRFDI